MGSTVDNSTKLSRFSSRYAASFRRLAVILAVTFSLVVYFALGHGTATIAFAASAPTIHSFSSAPTSIAAGQSAKLSWTIQNAQSSSIDNGVGAVSGVGSVTVSPTVTTTYTLTASNNQGSATAQTTVTVTQASDTSAPTVPTGLAATGVSTSQINLTWNASTDNVGVVGYRVYRNGSLAASPSGTSFSDINLFASTTYTYNVTAYDAAGNTSAQSSPASATTLSAADTQAPTVPPGLAANGVSTSQINVTWNASTDNVGVTGYRVYRNGALIATASGTSYSNTGLSASTTYTYNVAAYDAAGNTSAQSSPASATTSAGADTQAPTVPTGLAASGVSTSQINLTWSASTDNVGVVGYRVYRNGSLAASPSGTSFSDINLFANTTYTYNVTAYDAAGNTSAQSSPVSATTSAAADTQAPTVSITAPTGGMVSGSVAIAANAADNTSIASVQFYVDGATVGQPITTTPYSTMWNTTIATNSSHVLSAMARDSAGNSAMSSGVSVTVNNTTSTKPYGTSFPLTENPISENNNWINGLSTGLDWGNVQTTAGLAFGTNVSGAPPYNDSTAVLAGTWGPNQTVTGTVHSVNQTSSIYEEVELRLRTTITPHNITGYEINFRCTSDGSQYIGIVRWNGPLNNFSYVTILDPGGPGIHDGDVVSASIVGSTITGYINGVAVITGTDSTYTNGSPGIGFWNQNGTVAANPNYGFISFSASDGSTTDTSAPSTPTNLSAVGVSPSQINLSWTPSTDNVLVTGYKIFRNSVQVGTSPSNSFSDTGLNSNTSYSYSVAAFDAAGNVSGQSLTATASTGGADTTPPSVPSGLTSSNVSQTSATLSWTASTDNVGVAGYQIFRNGTQVGTTSSTSYTDTGLTASTTYDYSVAAYDLSNNHSSQTGQIMVTTLAPPLHAPTFVQMTQTQISSGSSVSVPFNSATTSGNTIVAYVIWSNAASAIVTDSQGNAFTSVTAPVSWGGGNSTQIFYATNVAGGADTVTATFRNAVSSFGVIYIHEYAGISATNPVDVTVSATGSSAAINSGSATTTSPNDLIFGAGVSDMSVTAVGPGFTGRSLAFGNVTEDESATAAGSYAATATHDGIVWEMQMVAFRAAN
jgi:chitodextrinase